MQTGVTYYSSATREQAHIVVGGKVTIVDMSDMTHDEKSKFMVDMFNWRKGGYVGYPFGQAVVRRYNAAKPKEKTNEGRVQKQQRRDHHPVQQEGRGQRARKQKGKVKNDRKQQRVHAGTRRSRGRKAVAQSDRT